MTLDLDPIRARLAAATPGPWEYRPFTEIDPDGAFDLAHVVADDPDDPAGDQVSVCASIMRPDADLIANAPTDMAALVAEVERLRVAVWRVREVHSLQVSSVWGEVCEECVDAYTERHKPYPCPTLRAAEGVE